MRHRKPRTLLLGTVSCATMRPEDLIPAFLSAAEDLRLSRADRATIREIRARESRSEDVEYYSTDEADWDLESLFDLLGNYVPPFCYFGAHPGDGADYGVWVYEDFPDDAIREGEILSESSNGFKTTYAIGQYVEESLDAIPEDLRKGARYRLVISDHGNMTLYHRNGREVWGIV